MPKVHQAKLAPIWKRAYRTFREEGWAGVRYKSWRRLGAEALRGWLYWHSRGLPGRVAAHREVPITPDQVRTVAFLKLWGLGDTVMATPALKMLRRHFTAARIILVAPSAVCGVLRGTPVLDEVVELPQDDFLFRLGPSPALYRAFRRVQLLAPELLLVSYPMNFWRIREILERLGARWVIAPELDLKPGRGTVRVPIPDDRHTVLVNADLSAAAGCAGDVPPMDLWLTEAERAEAAAWLGKTHPPKPWVCFHVGSTPGLPQKKWPADYFIELGNRLQRKRGGAIFILEGQDETEEVRRVAAGLERPPRIVGRELSLRGAMALIERMDAVVAGSSVWMHVAVATKAPVVCISGPTPPSYGPWGDPAIHREVRSPVSCSPCWDWSTPIACQDPECMRQITVPMVETVVEELLLQAQTCQKSPAGLPAEKD